MPTIKRGVDSRANVTVFIRNFAAGTTLKAELKKASPDYQVIHDTLRANFTKFELIDEEGDLLRRTKPRLKRVKRRTGNDYFLRFELITKAEDYDFSGDGNPAGAAIIPAMAPAPSAGGAGDPEEGTITITVDMTQNPSTPSPIEIPVVIED
jgi:hypothetical protein